MHAEAKMTPMLEARHTFAIDMLADVLAGPNPGSLVKCVILE
jgi:hypothetical protein